MTTITTSLPDDLVKRLSDQAKQLEMPKKQAD
jgi:predicted transcriptional regulator